MGFPGIHEVIILTPWLGRAVYVPLRGAQRPLRIVDDHPQSPFRQLCSLEDYGS